MKKSLFILFFMTSLAWGRCEEKARAIAEQSMELFNVGDQEMHCQAVGGMVKWKVLPVIEIYPPIYSYQAKYYYPCGPQPKKPEVRLTFNHLCQLMNLEIQGFKGGY